MKLNYITIMVRDMEKTSKFYMDLVGLEKIKEMNFDFGKILFLGNKPGETMLELIEFKQDEKVLAKGMVFSFLVNDDIEKLRNKAIELGYDPSEIIEEGKKPKHFKVLDPDGIVVEFGV